MIEITSLGQLLTFTKSAEKITVIDFYADWCGPCQHIKPDYERMSQYYDANEVLFCKCNVDRNRDAAQHFAVEAMPTFVVCLGGEILSTVRGGELGVVQRTVDMYLHRVAKKSSAFEPETSTAVSSAIEANSLTARMVQLELAVQKNETANIHGICTAMYNDMKMQAQAGEATFGVTLLPYLASGVFSPAAGNAFFANVGHCTGAHPHVADLLVNQVLRCVMDIASALTWTDVRGIELIHRMVLSLLECSEVRAKVVQSPFFFNDFIKTGECLERTTLLGVLLGIGPTARPQMWSRNFTPMPNWPAVLLLFSEKDGNTSEEKVYDVQKAVEWLADQNSRLVEVLLRFQATREATMRYFGVALQLNQDYQKIVHNNLPLSGRFFMTQLQCVLIDVALPIVRQENTLLSVPAHYLLDADSSRTVVGFGVEVERISHYDAECPLPAVPEGVETYRPVAHLFFLAIRALTLCATVFIEEHNRDQNNFTHPQVAPLEREAFKANMNLYKGLLGSHTLATRRLEFLDGLARWLLNIMQVDGDGNLKDDPPTEWKYLPQQLVDCTICATQLAPIEGSLMKGMVSLLLVLMGNTRYFPKAHTHAMFSSYLMRLMYDSPSRRVLEEHPWFTSHILRDCIHCYIAVEKSTYEKVSVRYELSACIKTFLESDWLCNSARQEIESKGTVLERFSHMAVADVNGAVDQLIEGLTQMHELMKSGADLSETAAAPSQANSNQRVSGENTDPAADEENEEAPNETMTYHQLGLSLRSSLLLFNATVDMFIQLAIQFPRGVSQNMVAQQISQMLARSLVAFAGPKSGRLKIQNPERYEFRPREVLSRLVRCMTHFRRTLSFLRSMCNSGIPLEDLLNAVETVTSRRLVSEDLSWKLAEMSSAMTTLSKDVVEEEAFWDEAPDFALDALLSTPLRHPVALPADVKNLDDLVYVNSETAHHLLLSENKHPFTKEYLDETMLMTFNNRPDVVEARDKLQVRINEWLQSMKNYQKRT